MTSNHVAQPAAEKCVKCGNPKDHLYHDPAYGFMDHEFTTADAEVAQPAGAGVEPDTPVEIWPNVPERIYLYPDGQGLWRRTAFGDLPNVVAYAPVARTPPPDVQQRARRLTLKISPWLRTGDGELDPKTVDAVADIIAAEFGSVGHNDT